MTAITWEADQTDGRAFKCRKLFSQDQPIYLKFSIQFERTKGDRIAYHGRHTRTYPNLPDYILFGPRAHLCPQQIARSAPIKMPLIGALRAKGRQRFKNEWNRTRQLKVDSVRHNKCVSNLYTTSRIYYNNINTLPGFKSLLLECQASEYRYAGWKPLAGFARANAKVLHYSRYSM